MVYKSATTPPCHHPTDYHLFPYPVNAFPRQTPHSARNTEKSHTNSPTNLYARPAGLTNSIRAPQGRYRVARVWSRVSGVTPGHPEQTNRNPERGGIMRGRGLNAECNHEHHETEPGQRNRCKSIRRIIPPLPGFIYICWYIPRDSAAKAAPSPGYFISPLNRGSIFHSPPGGQTLSEPRRGDIG